MIVDDIIQFLERHSGQYTSTQIAMQINSSHGRVHSLLLMLYEQGIIAREVITEEALYHRSKTYYVWSLIR